MHLPAVTKPRLRGRLHQIAFFASIPAGITLVALARGAEARVGAAIFAATLSGLFGVSAAYHRG
jgi:hemolysin III